MSHRPKPLALTILDGLGYRQKLQETAIVKASKPCDNHLQKDYSMASWDSSVDMVCFSNESFLFNITQTLLNILGLLGFAEMTSPSFLLNK